MDSITPQIEKPKKSSPNNSNISLSQIFTNILCSNIYIEEIDKQNEQIILIFRNPEEINTKKQINLEKIMFYKEIKLIIDFQCLSKELLLDNLKIFINDLCKIITDESNKIKLSLAIENTLIKNFSQLMDKELILNELIISDELYNISPNLNIIFPELKVKKLVLKKFKINSKLQLSNFFNFISKTECKELFLEDIFVELIIKKDENDTEYNEINYYLKYIKGIITINNEYTCIQSLTLRDCPLFIMSENMFTLMKELEPKNLDIDENSIINPSIITKFKIYENKFHICFDLDSYKINKEEDEYNEKEEDYLDYLEYIFNIIIGFSDNEKDKNGKNEENVDDEDDEDDESIGNIDRECFYNLKFKNFDVTKYEYITNDCTNIIKEENWILNKEEKKRKEKWEKFEEKLKNFNFKKLSNVKMVSFENCSNFFVQWILYFIKGNEISNLRKSFNNDLELLKLKKCGKDYIDLKIILKMKINNLILFDTPLIIDHFNEDKKPHLDNISNLGGAQYLTIIINTLDFYNKEFKLNTYKTMEIIVELIQCGKFNKNLSFGMNALAMIMTFLVYREYVTKKDIYNNPTIEEKGEDSFEEKEIERMNKDNKVCGDEKLTFVSNQFFFCCKKYRDYLVNKVFKLNGIEDSKITILNTLIKNQSENFEFLNYLLVKGNRQDKRNKEFKKMEFGLNLINIDKDYKFFFSINCINSVTLKNVEFSNSINSLIKSEESQAFINLISFNEKENFIIKKNNYYIPKIPNYKMDIKTINGILFKNHLFEDIGAIFRYFMMKIEQPEKYREKQVKREEIDKKSILMEYFYNYNKKFDCIKKYVKKFTFIIYNRNELKELNCILGLAKVLADKKNWIREKLIGEGKIKEIELPNKKVVENEIGPYFLKDKNEEEEEVYSEFNYYFTNPVELKMLNDKKISINEYTYYLDFQFEQ